MNIGFDISQTCETKSGTGFWADQLINALSRVDSENSYTLFPWFYDYRPIEVEKATTIHQKNFTKLVTKNFTDNNPKIEKLDVIHSNNFRYPNDVSARKVVTIYDVCFLDCPEYTTEANRLFCYNGTIDSMLYADKIIAISKYTKDRLLHFFPFVDSNKVEVVYCGNRESLLNEKVSIDTISKYQLDENEYYLSVGTIEPRKNYDTLIDAYLEYRKSVANPKKLCIAGGYGWMQDHFKSRIEELGLSKSVVVTGYVSDNELANLYKYCYCYISTTWYEGFGLPILEALNFEKPTIVSKVASIPEIVGDNAVFINPLDVDTVIKGMVSIEEDSNLFNSLRCGCKKETSRFSWDDSANHLLKVYGELMQY